MLQVSLSVEAERTYAVGDYSNLGLEFEVCELHNMKQDQGSYFLEHFVAEDSEFASKNIEQVVVNVEVAVVGRKMMLTVEQEECLD